MTLSQLLADCYRRLSYAASPAADVTTRLTAFLNESQDEILSRPGFSGLRRQVLTFSSVANQAEYTLAQPITKVLQLRELTNMIRLQEISDSFYRSILPDPSRQTGTSYAYALMGLNPTNAPVTLFLGTIAVISTDAADTQNAYVELLLDDNTVWSSSRGVNGIAGGTLSLPTGRTLKRVLDFYLASAATGTVSLGETLVSGPPNSVTPVLGQITQGNFRAYYRSIALIPTPSSVLTYTADVELQNTPLVNPGDSPIIPLNFHRIIAIGARKKEYEFKGDSERRELADREWQTELGYINNFLVNPPDQAYVNGRAITGPSVLPPWFPQSGYLQ